VCVFKVFLFSGYYQSLKMPKKPSSRAAVSLLPPASDTEVSGDDGGGGEGGGEVCFFCGCSFGTLSRKKCGHALCFVCDRGWMGFHNENGSCNGDNCLQKLIDKPAKVKTGEKLCVRCKRKLENLSEPADCECDLCDACTNFWGRSWSINYYCGGPLRCLSGKSVEPFDVSKVSEMKISQKGKKGGGAKAKKSQPKPLLAAPPDTSEDETPRPRAPPQAKLPVPLNKPAGETEQSMGEGKVLGEVLNCSNCLSKMDVGLNAVCGHTICEKCHGTFVQTVGTQFPCKGNHCKTSLFKDAEADSNVAFSRAELFPIGTSQTKSILAMKVMEELGSVAVRDEKTSHKEVSLKLPVPQSPRVNIDDVVNICKFFPVHDYPVPDFLLFLEKPEEKDFSPLFEKSTRDFSAACIAGNSEGWYGGTGVNQAVMGYFKHAQVKIAVPLRNLLVKNTEVDKIGILLFTAIDEVGASAFQNMYYFPSLLDNSFIPSDKVFIPPGSVFIDVIKPESRPLGNKNNVAMVYVAVPHGKSFIDAQDFYSAIEITTRSVVAACNVINGCGNYSMPGEKVPEMTLKYKGMYRDTPDKLAFPEPIRKLRMSVLGGISYRHPEANTFVLSSIIIGAILQEYMVNFTPAIEFIYDPCDTFFNGYKLGIHEKGLRQILEENFSWKPCALPKLDTNIRQPLVTVVSDAAIPKKPKVIVLDSDSSITDAPTSAVKTKKDRVSTSEAISKSDECIVEIGGKTMVEEACEDHFYGDEFVQNEDEYSNLRENIARFKGLAFVYGEQLLIAKQKLQNPNLSWEEKLTIYSRHPEIEYKNDLDEFSTKIILTARSKITSFHPSNYRRRAEIFEEELNRLRSGSSLDDLGQSSDVPVKPLSESHGERKNDSSRESSLKVCSSTNDTSCVQTKVASSYVPCKPKFCPSENWKSYDDHLSSPRYQKHFLKNPELLFSEPDHFRPTLLHHRIQEMSHRLMPETRKLFDAFIDKLRYEKVSSDVDPNAVLKMDYYEDQFQIVGINDRGQKIVDVPVAFEAIFYMITALQEADQVALFFSNIIGSDIIQGIAEGYDMSGDYPLFAVEHANEVLLGDYECQVTGGVEEYCKLNMIPMSTPPQTLDGFLASLRAIVEVGYDRIDWNAAVQLFKIKYNTEFIVLVKNHFCKAYEKYFVNVITFKTHIHYSVFDLRHVGNEKEWITLSLLLVFFAYHNALPRFPFEMVEIFVTDPKRVSLIYFLKHPEVMMDMYENEQIFIFRRKFGTSEEREILKFSDTSPFCGFLLRESSISTQPPLYFDLVPHEKLNAYIRKCNEFFVKCVGPKLIFINTIFHKCGLCNVAFLKHIKSMKSKIFSKPFELNFEDPSTLITADELISLKGTQLREWLIAKRFLPHMRRSYTE